MSFFFPEVDKIYVYKRKGTQDDPYVSISESLKVVNGRIILKEVPDLFTKVTVKDSNGNFLYETTNLTLNANEYRVDYSLGIVYFNSSNEGKEFTFDYQGVGLIAFPASRIWTRESNGEITETLQGLIDTATIARDSANEVSVNFVHKGEYDNATQYKSRNIVSYQGAIYIAIADTQGNPPTNQTYWKQLTFFNWKGTYSSSTTYNYGNFVADTNNYNIYMSVANNNTGNSLSNTSYWTKIINAQTVIDNMITAKNNANTATTNANNAASNANNAATSATNAANNANTQATYAQTQGDYAKSQGDYAKSVADQNKTIWKAPVANFAAIATTYPSPSLGWTVMTLDDGKIYRYDGTTWQFTQQYNSTALNNLSNELSKQNQQSTTIGHGLNIIKASQNSPLDVRIEGRTLVNVSQSVLDPAKYYVLADKKFKVKFSDATTYTDIAKFQGKAEKPILIRVLNFEGKVSGSTVENPHIARYKGSTTFITIPSSDSEFKNDGSVVDYSKISKLDGTIASASVVINSSFAQHLFSFNLIEAIERNVGKIPANDTAGKVTWLKNNINALTIRWYGYGTSPSSNKAYLAVYNNTSSSWVDTINHTNGSVTQLTFTISGASITDRIDSNGFIHFLAYADPSNGTVASTIYTDYVELETELKQNAQLWNPRFPLYEVDATEYANILTTWDENEVMRRYPMVESVQHVQNPYVIAEGENLLPPFTEWTLHANAVVREPYKLELNATGTYQSSIYVLNVINGQTYTISLGSFNGEVVLYKKGTAYGTDVFKVLTNGSYTFTVDSSFEGKVTVSLTSGSKGAGTYTFSSPMLTLDSTAKPFVPRNPSMLLIDGVKLGALSDKKDILWKDGQDWKVTKWIEKDVVLDGKLAWVYHNDQIGFKSVRIDNYTGTTNNSIMTKYNGTKVPYVYNIPNPDNHFFGSANVSLYISISDTDSGWGEHYKPSAQEVQAYFNGWKANGYTTGTAVTNELTGQLANNGTYTFAQNGAYRNVVVKKSTDNSTWSSATENTDFKIDISGTKAVLTNLSASPLYFRISYNYGVTVNSWVSLVDGSAPATNTLAYVSANMAPGFTPYKLSYVLATPQTIVVTDKVEGDLVVNGATQVEVGSGVVIREKANPVQYNTDGTWHINWDNSKNGVIPKGSELKNKTQLILSVFKNGVKDTNWNIVTTTINPASYGLSRAYIEKNKYDATAEYTVTYLILNTDRCIFTTNILSVIANYDASLKSVVDDVVAKQSDIAAQVSVNVRAIAELYKRLKALGG